MNHNKTVLCLKLGFIWSSIIIIMFFFLVFLEFITSKPIDINLKIYTFFITLLTTATVIILYNLTKNQVHAVEYDIIDISKTFLFFDYYSRWLPGFLITFGICIFIISIVYQIMLLVLLGFLIFDVGIFSFFTVYTKQYDAGLDLNFELSYMVFMRYIYKKETVNPIFIEKFTYFFDKCLRNIDTKLYKGIKISNLTVEADNLSIRTIILYLSPYVKYGGQSEAEILKSSLVNMREFIAKDNKLKSLKITTCILDIYKNEKKFMSTYNYQIEPINPLIKLYEDIKNPLIIFFVFSILIILTICKSSFIADSMVSLFQSDLMETLIQPITMLFTSLLGIIGTIFGIIISSYIRK